MFEDLKAALGGVADLSSDISKAVADTAANTRVAYDAANGFWRPVGGSVPPGGDTANSDVQIGTQHSLMDTIRPWILPALGLLLLIGGIWAVVRMTRKKKD